MLFMIHYVKVLAFEPLAGVRLELTYMAYETIEETTSYVTRNIENCRETDKTVFVYTKPKFVAFTNLAIPPFNLTFAGELGLEPRYRSKSYSYYYN